MSHAQETNQSLSDQSGLADLSGLSGLTEADAQRVAAAFVAARAPSTRALYARLWGVWERWCTARGLVSLPGDPGALCAYLAERAAGGTAVVSLDVCCSAIRHTHRIHGHPDPVAHESVRQVRAGLRRTYGTAPRRQARPLTVAELHQILARLDPDRPGDARDAAIILLGYAGALRRSELAALALADIEHHPTGNPAGNQTTGKPAGLLNRHGFDAAPV
ncbi:hypothetical protein [Nocardioides sp. YIM 152315]|uniref:hypothetical protein n=1 Tax=Nocardioides sp. YIM 152315 TaxID=3031760 RepID=UPI0023DCBB7B|nr:hypothetical protein [Nocardioides sp. YIM 152315]MDF1605813.1 hypothetical protein [Nocardioides sp. YIM 152315]